MADRRPPIRSEALRLGAKPSKPKRRPLTGRYLLRKCRREQRRSGYYTVPQSWRPFPLGEGEGWGVPCGKFTGAHAAAPWRRLRRTVKVMQPLGCRVCGRQRRTVSSNAVVIFRRLCLLISYLDNLETSQ